MGFRGEATVWVGERSHPAAETVSSNALGTLLSEKLATVSGQRSYNVTACSSAFFSSSEFCPAGQFDVRVA